MLSLFSRVIDQLYLFLGDMSMGFFNWVFLSFIIDLEQFLYSLDSRPLSDTRFRSIFYQFHGLSFHFPDVVL